MRDTSRIPAYFLAIETPKSNQTYGMFGSDLCVYTVKIITVDMNYEVNNQVIADRVFHRLTFDYYIYLRLDGVNMPIIIFNNERITSIPLYSYYCWNI